MNIRSIAQYKSDHVHSQVHDEVDGRGLRALG